MHETSRIERTVIENNLCIGCGACALYASGKISIALSSQGFNVAKVNDDIREFNDRIEKVCPFSDKAKNEDELWDDTIRQDFQHDKSLGYYLSCFAGRVNDEKEYAKSSSGGLIKWILKELLDRGCVDRIIHVLPSTRETKQSLFTYTVADTKKEIEAGSTSAYYPVEMSKVLEFVRENPGQYAITGVPCFIKAIRLIQKEDLLFAERIKFTIGLVCGHLKSTGYAEMTGWQLGVKPADLTGIDFRVKIQGKTAKEKGVIAYSANPDQGEVVPRTIQELYGTNYGWGFFKYNACDFCDDVFSETADVSVGDAWLPKYIDRGTNIIIVRNKKILQLLINGEKAGRLFLEPLDSFNVATSQESGLRHRREGLAYRLYLKQKRGEWTPAKRVSPSNDKISMIYKMIYRMRIALSKKSVEKFIEAKKRNNLTYFRKSMLIYMAVYDLLYILYRLFNRGTKTKTS